MVQETLDSTQKPCKNCLKNIPYAAPTEEALTSALAALQRTKKIALAPPELAEQRYLLCLSCEHLLTDTLCQKCGCYVGLRTRMLNERCPLGKSAKW